jgi:hypothetical protein
MASKQQKRQAKSGASKRREKRYVPPEKRENAEQEAPDHESGGGAMQSLTSGFKRAVGVETKKKKTWVDHIWTILLLLAIAAVLMWRFGGS